ncbi:ketimine reductase mu-crystallin-like isoform X2 [Gigantopelta aegis]|nr:ketimine reductase mu-crystallin-like isoform X2 [Gigantopelta aegis]
MPGYSEHDDALVTKLVSFFPNNKNVHSHNAILVVMDANTGIPKAILDGNLITAKRTAAASAVATKYLVNGTPEILAILGAGCQARTHFDALSHLYKFKQVRIWNHRFESAEKLSKDVGAVVCKTAEEAVKDADVIVTVTASPTPVLKKGWVKPGAHINAVGACRTDWHEIDPTLMTSVTLYVDDVESATQQSGDIIISKAKIYGEIGEVILGRKDARRTETTLFKSMGIAIEDVISAKLVLDRLEQK